MTTEQLEKDLRKMFNGVGGASVTLPIDKVEPHATPVARFRYFPDEKEYVLSVFLENGTAGIDDVLVHTHTFTLQSK